MDDRRALCPRRAERMAALARRLEGRRRLRASTLTSRPHQMFRRASRAARCLTRCDTADDLTIAGRRTRVPSGGSEGEKSMNGAESLVRTLVGGGVDVCFANPGTSEMHFVAALDRVDGMRCVLGPVRGGRHRCCRRLCPDEREAGRDPAASRPRPRQRARQHPQRQQGVLADGQHRRRPRDLSPQIRCAA